MNTHIQTINPLAYKLLSIISMLNNAYFIAQTVVRFFPEDARDEILRGLVHSKQEDIPMLQIEALYCLVRYVSDDELSVLLGRFAAGNRYKECYVIREELNARSNNQQKSDNDGLIHATVCELPSNDSINELDCMVRRMAKDRSLIDKADAKVRAILSLC